MVFWITKSIHNYFKAIGKEIADRYRDAGVQRIVTIEASGIALALMAALELDVPLVFARKKKSILMVDDVYHSVVYSYTKEEKLWHYNF